MTGRYGFAPRLPPSCSALCSPRGVFPQSSLMQPGLTPSAGIPTTIRDHAVTSVFWGGAHPPPLLYYFFPLENRPT